MQSERDYIRCKKRAVALGETVLFIYDDKTIVRRRLQNKFMWDAAAAGIGGKKTIMLDVRIICGDESSS